MTAAAAPILAQRCFVTHGRGWKKALEGTVRSGGGNAAELLHQVGAERLFCEFEGFVYRMDRIGIKGLY